MTARRCNAVVALLALAGSSVVAQPNVAVTRTVTVDGHAMRVQTLGLDTRKPRSPIIVLEAGVIQSLDSWLNLPAQLSAIAPVVAYDRAGLGRSESDNKPPTPRHVTSRLHSMLQQIGAGPPYILVGYSWGGVLTRYYAGYYPNEVAGLVYVDPGPTVTQPRSENLAPFDAVGAGRAGYDAYWSMFSGLFARTSGAVRAEFEVMRELMERELAQRDLRPAPNVPVVVIVAAKYLPLQGIQLPYDPRAHFEADVRHRIKMLEEWTLASSQGTLVVSNHTTHAIPREDPDLIVWAVQRVFAAVPPTPPTPEEQIRVSVWYAREVAKFSTRKAVVFELSPGRDAVADSLTREFGEALRRAGLLTRARTDATGMDTLYVSLSRAERESVSTFGSFWRIFSQRRPCQPHPYTSAIFATSIVCAGTTCRFWSEQPVGQGPDSCH